MAGTGKAQSITITGQSSLSQEDIGRMVKDLQFDPESRTLTFLHKASALPWVVPDDHSAPRLKWNLPTDASIGYALTKAGHKLSGDRLKVTGLPAGQYEVFIDDVGIGTWTNVALGTKVEIQENEKTPQYQQASKIAELNRKRNDEAIRPMRDKWSTIKGLRKRYADKPEQLEINLAKARLAITELHQIAQTIDHEIHETSQPAEHRWTIRPVTVIPNQKK